MLQEILSKFPINYEKISRIDTGLINETYLVQGEQGSFILQKVNPIFSLNITGALYAISNHLNKNGLIAQKLIKTKDNKLVVTAEKNIWRLLTYIPGVVVEKIENANMAYEAGKILGKFHGAIQDLKYNFKNPRELHHNSQKLFNLFIKSTSKNKDPEIDGLKKTISDLPKFLLPKNLRRNLTHGDPKISNIIFQSFDGAQEKYRALALIDFDDAGKKHNLLTELGDAFRSWCGNLEDNPKNYFDLTNFKEALRGYKNFSKNLITDEEKVLIPGAIKLITLELASRFLRDYFEDNYFGWNKNKYASRKAHNLARAKGQVALYYDILKKENDIYDIIQTVS